MPVLTADRVAEALRKGSSARLGQPVVARFQAGDAVRVHNAMPAGHTRVPRYVRDKRGVIARDHGVFILPDAHARDGTKQPDRLYSVRFEASVLWGDDANAASAVYIDMFQSYLDPDA